MAFPPGTTIADYRLVKKLGEGGMGEVYLALHKLLGQQVVLKSLHAQLLGNDEMRARFVREAEAMALLSHPNILKVFNLLDLPEGVFIVMEYVEGEDYDALLNRTGPLPPERAIELVLPVLSALAFAHSKGVIHRDIKPANIMLLKDGEVRVLDFGIAKMESRPGLTRVGMTLGTATYMPPEQHLGLELTQATDIYALAVTLYELLTARLPFESEDTGAFIMKVMREPPASPRLYYPEIPERLERCLLLCLEKKPESRLPSADAFERELRAILKELRKEREAATGKAPAPTARSAGADAPPRPEAALPLGGAGSTIAGLGAGLGVAGVLGGASLLQAGAGPSGLALVGAGSAVWLGSTLVLSRALGRLQAMLIAQPEPSAALAPAAGAPMLPTAPTAPLAVAVGAPPMQAPGYAPGYAPGAASWAPQPPQAGAPAGSPRTEPAFAAAGGGGDQQRTVPGIPAFDGPNFRTTSTRRAIEPWRHTSFDIGAVDSALESLGDVNLPTPRPRGGGANLTVPMERHQDRKTVVVDRTES